MGDIKARKKSLNLDNLGHPSPSEDDDGRCTFCLDSMDVEMLQDDIVHLHQKLQRSTAACKMEEGYGNKVCKEKGVEEEGKKYGKQMILEMKDNFQVTPNPDPGKEQKSKDVLSRKEKEDSTKKEEESEDDDGAEKKDEEKEKPQEDGEPEFHQLLEIKSDKADVEMEGNQEEEDEENSTQEEEGKDAEKKDKGKDAEKKDKEKENSEEEKDVCEDKDDNTSQVEGESKLLPFQDLNKMGEEKKAMADKEEEEKEVCHEKPAEDKESTNVSLDMEGLSSIELEAVLDRTLIEIEDTYWITHVSDSDQNGKSSGQQPPSSTENSTSSASSTSGQTSGASGGLHSLHGGGDGVSGGDDQPPNRGPPSRLRSQCEEEGNDQALAEEQKKADQFGDFYCQDLELSLSLDDDDPPDPPGSLHSHSLDPEPSAGASHDLESFPEMVSAGMEDQSLLVSNILYLRPDMAKDIAPSKDGRYKEGDEYEKGVILGEGSYGKVYYMTDKTSKKTFAIKEIPLESFNVRELNGIHLKQRNFAQMYGAMVTKATNSEGEEILVVVCIIQQLIPNSATLQQVIEDFPEWSLTPDDIARILHEILEALQEMGLLGITHSDLHAGNLLITEGLRVYIIDWGQSTVHDLTGLTGMQAFRDAAARDVQLASDRINDLIRCFLRQRETQKDIEWESDEATLAFLKSVLDKVPELEPEPDSNGSSRDTPTAESLLQELNSGLAETAKVFGEIVCGERDAIRPRLTGEEEQTADLKKATGDLSSSVKETPALSSNDAPDGAVGGFGRGSLVTDEDSLPFTSASSTYESNLSNMEYDNF